MSRLDDAASVNTSTRPKVAYVAHSVDPNKGGMELVSARLIDGLRSHFDVEVVAGDGLETLPAGVRRTRVAIPAAPNIARLVIFDLLGSWRLRAVRRRSDLVHSCGVVAHARVDIVSVHLSHVSVIEAQGSARPPGRRGISGSVAALRRRFAAGLERWGLQPGRVRYVVALSAADRATLAERHGNLRVVEIPNGVDLDRFAAPPRPHRPHDGPLRVVVVAGDFERKGVPLAVRAIAQVPDATLIVAGAGDRAAMVALANDLGAGDRIEFLGHVDDLQSVYASADVVLSCSAHESFGLALVEGAASGCVVVSTDTGVAGSLCALDEQGKRAGVLVEPDAASVAAALRQLADSPASLMEMSHCAQIRAQGFSWQAMVEATVDLYREALKR